MILKLNLSLIHTDSLVEYHICMVLLYHMAIGLKIGRLSMHIIKSNVLRTFHDLLLCRMSRC